MFSKLWPILDDPHNKIKTSIVSFSRFILTRWQNSWHWRIQLKIIDSLYHCQTYVWRMYVRLVGAVIVSSDLMTESWRFSEEQTDFFSYSKLRTYVHVFTEKNVTIPSLNTQSCIRRPLCSTLKFENLSISLLKFITKFLVIFWILF